MEWLLRSYICSKSTKLSKSLLSLEELGIWHSYSLNWRFWSRKKTLGLWSGERSHLNNNIPAQTGGTSWMPNTYWLELDHSSSYFRVGRQWRIFLSTVCLEGRKSPRQEYSFIELNDIWYPKPCATNWTFLTHPNSYVEIPKVKALGSENFGLIWREPSASLLFLLSLSMGGYNRKLPSPSQEGSLWTLDLWHLDIRLLSFWSCEKCLLFKPLSLW